MRAMQQSSAVHIKRLENDDNTKLRWAGFRMVFPIASVSV